MGLRNKCEGLFVQFMGNSDLVKVQDCVWLAKYCMADNVRNSFPYDWLHSFLATDTFVFVGEVWIDKRTAFDRLFELEDIFGFELHSFPL